MSDFPRLSIVTVTYNAARVVRETLESVVQQTYPNIEYIVIDGGSTDGTQDIINGFRENISHFRSEPDNGTYDAMNKAIDIASGEWIHFINAGDYYASRTTLEDIFSRPFAREVDFIYGDYIWKGERNEVRIPARPLELMWQRISFSHQSLFARTSLMKQKKFDLRWKIVSDYNFYFSSYMEGRKFCRVDFPVSVFRAGGLSDVNFLLRTYERWRVVKRYKKEIKVDLYYISILISHYKKKFIR